MSIDQQLAILSSWLFPIFLPLFFKFRIFYYEVSKKKSERNQSPEGQYGIWGPRPNNNEEQACCPIKYKSFNRANTFTGFLTKLLITKIIWVFKAVYLSEAGPQYR